MIWEGCLPLSNCTLAFAVTLRKIIGNVSQYSRVVKRPHSLHRLGWPAERQFTSVTHVDFIQPSVGTRAFQVAEMGGLGCNTYSFQTWLRAADLQIGHT
jgi:hypothetical protein